MLIVRNREVALGVVSAADPVTVGVGVLIQSLICLRGRYGTTLSGGFRDPFQ